MKALSTALLLITMIACAGQEPVSLEELAAEEQRILSPFMDAQTIVARTVQVEMTGNFFDEFMAIRVVQPAHKVSHEFEGDGGSTYRYTAVRREPVMMFQIGKTKLAVEEELILHVLGGRHGLTLEVEARVVTLARGDTQANMRTLRIADGAFTRNDAGR